MFKWMLLMLCCTSSVVLGRTITLPEGSGAVNVKDHGALGDGKTDDTEAFRKALSSEQADNKQLVLFIPRGTYLLSDTLGWPKRRTLLGEARDGVVLKLKDAAEGFGDAAEPRPLIHAAIPGPHYGKDSWVNAAFDNYIENLTIDTGRGNPGAVALRYTTHNNGMVDSVTIRSADGSGAIGLDLSQTEFGPGMVRDLLVEGFDTGIKTPGMVSNAVMQSITLRGQKVLGIDNRFPLQLRGLRSHNKVPAVRNTGPMAHLVLLDAQLTGGDADTCAIENRSPAYYLRNISAGGYLAALKDQDGVVAGLTIDERLQGSTYGGGTKHLRLPMEDPPPIHDEPAEKWNLLQPSGADDTDAIQQALDSGSATIFFKPGKYTISRTLAVGPAVRRMLAVKGAVLIKGDFKNLGNDKPFIRLSGGTDPISIEHLYVSAWPNRIFGWEIDTNRPLYLLDSGIPHPGGEVRNTANAAGGKLFLVEANVPVNFSHPQSVWAWQFNLENNPFRPGKSKIQTYLTLSGGQAWILGMKTEAPAVHLVAENGAKIELLGGFFRDHFGTEDVPYFRVNNASLSASYFQFAHQRGAARSLQAVTSADGKEVRLTLEPTTQTVGLFATSQSPQR